MKNYSLLLVRKLILVSFLLVILSGCASFFSSTKKVVGPELSEAQPRTSSAGMGSYSGQLLPLYPSLYPELANQLCFEVKIEVIGDAQEALLENWPFILIDSNQERFDLQFSEDDLRRSPESGLIGSYYGKKKKYSNHGRLCLPQIAQMVSWKQTLSVTVSPKLMPLLVKGDLNFYWEYFDPKEQNTENENKAHPPSYQKYRGY